MIYSCQVTGRTSVATRHKLRGSFQKKKKTARPRAKDLFTQ